MGSKAKWIIRIHATESEQKLIGSWSPLELVEDNEYLNTRMVIRARCGYIVEVIDARTRKLISVPENFILTTKIGGWEGVYIQPGLDIDSFIVEFV